MDIHLVPKLLEHSFNIKIISFIIIISNILLHIKFVFLFDVLYKHNKLLMKDVHLNDVEQYLLLLLILMLNNNYMLNQVEHLLDKKKI